MPDQCYRVIVPEVVNPVKMLIMFCRFAFFEAMQVCRTRPFRCETFALKKSVEQLDSGSLNAPSARYRPLDIHHCCC